MIRTIISTDDSIATTILRLVLGGVFFAHGAQKMLGWFGGFGFAGTMGFVTGTMHIPAQLAVVWWGRGVVWSGREPMKKNKLEVFNGTQCSGSDVGNA